MPKMLTNIGLALAVLILIPFAVDLAAAWPFKRASAMMDISFIIAAAILGYLSWNARREQI
jgi:UDP-N-acetylmuramyl pentapeptide phosphotransferase/UDP-N-acetylglucosamine-1-phosphate transferase